MFYCYCFTAATDDSLCELFRHRQTTEAWVFDSLSLRISASRR